MLEVGARLNGHASFGTLMFKTTSLYFAREDLGLPVKEMILTENFFGFI